MEHIFVALERDADGYPPYDSEELDAEPLGGDRFRIESIPVFAFGLARGDVVKVVAVRGDGAKWATEVVEPNDHVTARVLPWDRNALDDVAAEFVQLGCHAYSTPFGLVAVDVPSRVTANVMDHLNHGRAIGRWDFDLGLIPARSGQLDPDPSDD